MIRTVEASAPQVWERKLGGEPKTSDFYYSSPRHPLPISFDYQSGNPAINRYCVALINEYEIVGNRVNFTPIYLSHIPVKVDAIFSRDWYNGDLLLMNLNLWPGAVFILFLVVVSGRHCMIFGQK